MNGGFGLVAMLAEANRGELMFMPEIKDPLFLSSLLTAHHVAP